MNAWLDAGEAQRIDAAALDDVIVICHYTIVS